MSTIQEHEKLSGPEYKLQNASTGFGYRIMEINIFENPENPAKKIKNTKPVFHTSSFEQAQRALEQFRKNKMTRLVPQTKWEPMYLILQERHSSYHYLIRSEEELFKISFQIVKRRYKEGSYSFFDYINNDPIEEITEKDIENIKHLDLKSQAIKLRENYLKQIQNNANLRYWKKELTNILKTKDGAEAFYFMREMRFNGYVSSNDFELNTFDNKELLSKL